MRLSFRRNGFPLYVTIHRTVIPTAISCILTDRKRKHPTSNVPMQKYSHWGRKIYGAIGKPTERGMKRR